MTGSRKIFSFWYKKTTDLISTAGYDNIVQHLNDGRKNCKEFEDLRERRKIWEGADEPVTEEAVWTDRAKAKRLYEQRCRDKDEAEQAVHRSSNLVTLKQQEKLFVKLAQAKTALEDSDRLYQNNVNALEKIREEWQNEHVKACEFFESQECERINYFRNALWFHVNQLSEACVRNDDVRKELLEFGFGKHSSNLGRVIFLPLKSTFSSLRQNYEEIRKALEQCSIGNDIECFVHIRKTGNIPPAPVVYENYYNTQKNTGPRRSQLPVPGTCQKLRTTCIVDNEPLK
ncbi:hypothetical protein Chor_013663 [Crotalus horridus]